MLCNFGEISTNGWWNVISKTHSDTSMWIPKDTKINIKFLLKLWGSTQGWVIRTGFLWRLGFLLQRRSRTSRPSLALRSRPRLLRGGGTRTPLLLRGWLWGILGWLRPTLGGLPGGLALFLWLGPLLGLTSRFGTLAGGLRPRRLRRATRGALGNTLCWRRPLRCCGPLTELPLWCWVGWPGLLGRRVLGIRTGHRLGLGGRLALGRGTLLWWSPLASRSSAGRDLLGTS